MVRWLACLYVVGLTAIPSPGHATNPLTLRYRFRVGDVLRYRTTHWTYHRFPGTDRAVFRTGTLVESSVRVKAILPDGSAAVAIASSATKLRFPFRRTGKSTRTRCNARVGARGRIAYPRNACGRGVAGVVFGNALHDLVFPEQPVRPGDRWITRDNIALRLPFGGPIVTSRIRHTFTLRGIRRIAGHRRLVLAVDLRGSANSVHATGHTDVVVSGTGELLLSRSDGHPWQRELQTVFRVRGETTGGSFRGTSTISTFEQRVSGPRVHSDSRSP